MRASHSVLPALGQLLASRYTSASPLQLRPRQDTSVPVTTSAEAITTASASLSAAASPTGISIIATLFQAKANAFDATPLVNPDPPATGCIIASQTLSTWTEVFTYDLIPTTSYETDIITFTDGLYCMCASGMVAGTIESYNPEGTKFLFCATGDADLQTDLPTNAISTSDPKASALAGDPYNPDWADVSCDYGSLPNVGGSQDPAKMWNDSGANAAWDSMYSAWQVDHSTTYYNFSTYLINYFHGPTPNACDVVGQGSCNAGISCGTHNAPNAIVNSPAGYMIISTMEGLHQLLEAVSSGITNAAALIDVDGFTKAFSPITSELAEAAHTKLILDIVLLSVSVALVGVFEAAIPSLPAIKAAQAAEGVTAITDTLTWTTIKTEFYLNFGSSLGFVKDQLPSPTLSDAEAKVENYLDQVLQSLLAAVSKLAPLIFDDPEKLLPLIQNAAYWAGSKDNPPLSGIDSYDVTLQIQRAVWASALPLVWSTGTESRQVFIMTSDDVAYDADTGMPTNCDGWDPATSYNYVWTTQPPFVQIPDDQNAIEFFQSTFYCIDDKPYWMMTGNTHYTNIMNVDAVATDALDGKAWGGITAQDLVSSAVKVWKDNGEKNVQAIASDVTNSEQLQALVGATVATTPLAMIPVCSMEDAARTAGDDLSNSAGNPNWPCPAP